MNFLPKLVILSAAKDLTPFLACAAKKAFSAFVRSFAALRMTE